MTRTTKNFNDIATWLSESIAKLCGVGIHEVDRDESFAFFGLESIQIVALSDRLQEWLGYEISPATFFDNPTINELAKHLSGEGSDQEALQFVKNEKASNEPIAVIGMSLRFPGAQNPDEFWENLRNGKNGISKLGEHRLSSEWREKTDEQLFLGGFLDEINEFDNKLFGISPVEAARMDPQQRLMLTVTREAIEGAGYAPSELKGSRTGVFVGLSVNDYSRLSDGSPEDIDIYDSLGNAHSIAANRISYVFDLRGPSLSVDTACSSSLVSVHQACQAIRNGEAKMALAGGVNVIISPTLSKVFSRARMLSPDSQCKTFSNDANGYVRGEGAGCVFLKSLSEAEKDGDQILAVIRSSAVNQDGRSNGITAPNGKAQERVIEEALAKCDLTADDIDFIEAHGTGTPLGDPIEYDALKRVLSKGESKDAVFLGSVKANVGHLESAAGICGLSKVILSLKHREIPRQINFTKLNENINTIDSRLRIVTNGKKWDDDKVLRAGLSSFGFGGTNAHAIIESYDGKSQETNSKENLDPIDQEIDGIAIESASIAPNIHFLTASASEADTLLASAQAISTYLQENPLVDIDSSCIQANNQRDHLPHRLFVAAKNRSDFILELEKYRDKKASQCIVGNTQSRLSGKRIFMFTGQGNQYEGMGEVLYRSLNNFKKWADECDKAFEKYLPIPLRKILFVHNSPYRDQVMRADYGQCATFLFEYSLAKTLMDFGIRPDYVVGHSLGEIVACCVSGGIDIESAARLIAARSKLMQKTPEGGMLNIFNSHTEVNRLISQSDVVADIAAINGPNLCVVSGAPSEIEKVSELMSQNNIRTKAIKTDRAFHSRLMDEILDSFEDVASTIEFGEFNIPVISCVTGQQVESLSAKHWRDHIRNPTLFMPVIKQLQLEGAQQFIEIGPKPALTPMARTIAAAEGLEWLTASDRKDSDGTMFFEVLGKLYTSTSKINFKSAYSNAVRVHSNFPTTKNARHIFGKFLSDDNNKEEHVAAVEPKKELKKREVPMESQKNPDATIVNEIIGMLAGILGVSAAEIDPDESLLDIGADSLMLLHALQGIKNKYGVEIPVNDVFQSLNTARAIGNFVGMHAVQDTDNSEATVEEVVQIQPGEQTTDLQTPIQPSAPSIPSTTTLKPVDADGITELLQNQLVLMQQQIQLLQGQSVSLEKSQPQDSVARSSREVNEPKERFQKEDANTGVLSVFKSKIEHKPIVIDPYTSEMIAKFCSRTKITKNMTEKYRFPLADNRVSAGFRPNTKEMVYPIISDRSQGARIWDVDGNDYIDFSMSFGASLFGHSPKFINDAIKQQLEKTMAVGPQASRAGENAELFCKMTGHDRVAFCNSGTEAVMTAIRLARTATNRDLLIMFEGSYHGHADVVLAKRDLDGETIPVAPGVPQSVVGDVVVLKYGSEESLKYIEENAHRAAAVLVEPVQSRHPDLQPVDFLKRIREITLESNTAFIFDEVIWGLRAAAGGASEYFGIKADMGAYGKILGGGLPIGAIAGSQKYLDAIDGGSWKFGDDSFPQNQMTFFAGTFSKHPLTMASTHAILSKLSKDGEEIMGRLNRQTAFLAERLNRFFKEKKLEIEVIHFSSLFRFKSKMNLDMFFYNLNHRGMYVWEGRNLFISDAHTDEDIDRFIKAVKDSIEDLIDKNQFKKKRKVNPR